MADGTTRRFANVSVSALEEFRFSVAYEERRDWPTCGGDTLICTIGPSAITEERLIQWGLDIGEESAQRVRTHLHHGDFIITDKPDTIRDWARMPEHDECAECAAGTEAALAALRENPKLVIVVGRLFWCDEP